MITLAGLNNAFQTKAGTEVALQTGNKSVLESMHCQKSLLILKHKANPFEWADSSRQKACQKGIVEAILCTDMAGHGACLDNFVKRKPVWAEGSEVSESDAWLLRGTLLHAADLSNPTLEFENYMDWAKLLAQEFNSQVLAENEQGLEISSFLGYGGEEAFYKSQKGFAGGMALPLFRAIQESFPDIALAEEIEENLRRLDLEIEGKK